MDKKEEAEVLRLRLISRDYSSTLSLSALDNRISFPQAVVIFLPYSSITDSFLSHLRVALLICEQTRKNCHQMYRNELRWFLSLFLPSTNVSGLEDMIPCTNSCQLGLAIPAKEVK